jgi:hypothetical protein
MKRFTAVLWVFVLASISSLSSVSIAGTYSGGSGTEADPYKIATPADMNTLGATSADWSKCFKLVADINMSAYTGTKYKIIGNYDTKFTGTFDGDGHKIRNLTYTTSAFGIVGLFGHTSNAEIKNLGIENVNISTQGNYVGGLVGWQDSGTITNCYVTGSITDTSSYAVGGLIGRQDYGTVTNCYSMVEVTVTSKSASMTGGLIGKQYYGAAMDCYSTSTIASSSLSSSTGNSFVGGFIGYQSFGTATNCYSTGSSSAVTTSSTYPVFAGGLVGYQSSGTVTNCRSTSTVTSSNIAGGLISEQSSNSTARSCYSTGSVTSSSCAGGLIGEQGDSSTITNSYSAGPIVSAPYAGGLIGNQNSGITANCYNTRNVTSSYCAGGLIGRQYGTALNCYNTGSISVASTFPVYAGGLAGQFSYNSSGSKSQNCYSTGTVSANGSSVYKGGLIGSYTGGSITACFWDTEMSGMDYAANGWTPSGTQGKITSEMKTYSTFTDAGWDFVGETANGTDDTWQMSANDYPRLSWEEISFTITGDFDGDGTVDSADLAIFMSQWLCEKKNYDLYQSDGLHIVNFMDFSIFANSWDGDYLKLAEFMGEWLEYDAYSADITGDDDYVNFLDFAVLAENWMKE